MAANPDFAKGGVYENFANSVWREEPPYNDEINFLLGPEPPVPRGHNHYSRSYLSHEFGYRRGWLFKPWRLADPVLPPSAAPAEEVLPPAVAPAEEVLPPAVAPAEEAPRRFRTLANCAGRDDLLTEFLGYSTASEAMGIIDDPAVDCLIFESVDDPDVHRDLIYIKIGIPMTKHAFAKVLQTHLSRGNHFSYRNNFKGRSDRHAKRDMAFLASAKAGGDPTYVYFSRRASKRLRA
jgi:hypothetical protein